MASETSAATTIWLHGREIFVVVLLVVCALQAVYASGCNRLGPVFLASAFWFLAGVFAAYFTCNCYAASMLPPTVPACCQRSVSVAHTTDVDHQGRTLLQNNQCPQGVEDTCPSSVYWYCPPLNGAEPTTLTADVSALSAEHFTSGGRSVGCGTV